MLQSNSRTTRISKKLMRESVNHKLTPRAWSGPRMSPKKPGPGTTHNAGKFGREKKTEETMQVHFSKVYMHQQGCMQNCFARTQVFFRSCIVPGVLMSSMWHPLVIPKERSPGPWIHWLMNNCSVLLNVSKTQTMYTNIDWRRSRSRSSIQRCLPRIRAALPNDKRVSGATNDGPKNVRDLSPGWRRVWNKGTSVRCCKWSARHYFDLPSDGKVICN